MGKYLLPGAVVLVGVLALTVFRNEVLPYGGGLALVHDRWTGSVAVCGISNAGEKCAPISSVSKLTAASRETSRRRNDAQLQSKSQAAKAALETLERQKHRALDKELREIAEQVLREEGRLP